MKHSFFLIILLLTLLSCETPGKKPEAAEPLTDNSQQIELSATSMDSITQFLLASSASDFYKNDTTGTIRFRNIRTGYITSDNGLKQYILCGEYSSTGNEESWTPFTTIKTSDYELWLGKQSGVYCDDPAASWTHNEDLSSALQLQFDGLRKNVQ